MSCTNSDQTSWTRRLRIGAAAAIFAGIIAFIISFLGPSVPPSTTYVDGYNPPVARVTALVQDVRPLNDGTGGVSMDFTIQATSVPTNCNRTHEYLSNQEFAKLGPNVHQGSTIHFWIRTDRCDISVEPIPQQPLAVWNPGSDGTLHGVRALSEALFGATLLLVVILMGRNQRRLRPPSS